MSKDKTYQYNVFISYSSKDRPWAEQLYEDLESKGLNPFLDRQRLEPGAQWEPQLSMAVQKSQHFIVLWSNNAGTSQWVTRELGIFEAAIDPATARGIEIDRRLIFVTLEGENSAYSSFQMINDIKELDIYKSGVGSVPPVLWKRIVEKVANTIQSKDLTVPIAVAVLTMKKSDLNDFDDETWKKLNDLGFTKDMLEQRYGDKRTDWHPFGNDYTVSDILVDLRDEINNTVQGLSFRWEYVEEDFWTNLQVARNHAARLPSNLSLIVIDPIALLNDLVYRRFTLLNRCFENDRSAIMVLSPFTVPEPSLRLTQLVKDMGAPFFDSYYEPPVPPRSVSYANCGVNIADVMDIKRLVLITLGQYTRKSGGGGGPTSVYLGV